MPTDTAIVIATHNGVEHLREFFQAYRGDPEMLNVVDTGSAPEVYQEVRALCAKWGADCLRTPYRGYDTGAYLWAYWHLRHDNFLFLHDSMVPLVDDIVAPFAERMPERGAVGWVGFGMVWDSEEQARATMFLYGTDQPSQGIFGPVFYTNRATLREMSDRGLLPAYPATRPMAQGLERGWAILFRRAGFPVVYLNDYGVGKATDDAMLSSGAFGTFRKTRLVRA